MKLTRQQELMLMEIGAQALLRAIFPPKTKHAERAKKILTPKKEKPKYWTQTAAGRKRMSQIMRKRWIEKQKASSK